MEKCRKDAEALKALEEEVVGIKRALYDVLHYTM